MELKAKLATGKKQIRKSRTETRILLENNAKMTVIGDFQCFANSYIRVFPNSHLVLHGGFINENVQISCGETIEIGEGATIGRDVCIVRMMGILLRKKVTKLQNLLRLVDMYG